MIKPLGISFLFAFVNETRHGLFCQTSSGRIFVPNASIKIDDQGKFARFGKVLAVGERVTDFKNGDVVLISALRWTKGFMYDGVQIWKSDQDQVIAIFEGDDLNSIAHDYHPNKL